MAYDVQERNKQRALNEEQAIKKNIKQNME